MRLITHAAGDEVPDCLFATEIIIRSGIIFTNSFPGIFSMSYYQRHVFFCVNQREAGAACCNNHGAQAMRDYAKERVKALRLDSKSKRVRINNAGCLDRCNEGPVIVVYPEDIWYTYVDKEDIDEIVEEHLRNGRVVERLRI